ncbi:SCO2322 family protein [Streptomyces naphthomycinicus]|uniref:SCO2322 family protein n=1 Tax=Streptomyces naphthomycinicus TaxID=2872625 RepID=UPI001CED6ECD|nr:SCO2322 family protein [Streptomyces sp. TML10]
MSAVRRAVPVVAAALLLGSAGQADAAGYRYWSFWERTGDHWAYATQGPSATRPDDGAVEGFRFAVSADSADASRPRGAADFDAICSGTAGKPGTKRVAVVLDFGTRADAPSGEAPPERRTACARVASDATSADALAAVAEPLRYDTNALLCAIAGYPVKGCGEQVSAEEAGAAKDAADGARNDAGAAENDAGAAKKTGSDSGPSLGLPIGAGAVALLAAAAAWQARRRRDAAG